MKKLLLGVLITTNCVVFTNVSFAKGEVLIAEKTFKRRIVVSPENTITCPASEEIKCGVRVYVNDDDDIILTIFDPSKQDGIIPIENPSTSSDVNEICNEVEALLDGDGISAI